MVSAKDRELEETEERHQMEVKIYKQKVKHLLYEQENHLAGLKAENMVRISWGPSIKDVGIFLAIFDTPPPPCRNFNPDLPNPYLLISYNIEI